MTHYILKSFDDKGRRVGLFEFAAPDDVEAEGAVGDLAEALAQQLWAEDRFVRAWPATSLAKPASAQHPL